MVEMGMTVHKTSTPQWTNCTVILRDAIQLHHGVHKSQKFDWNTREAQTLEYHLETDMNTGGWSVRLTLLYRKAKSYGTP